MRKLLAIALTITTILLGTGCLSSVYHFGVENEYPYNSTTDVWTNCLGVWGHVPKNEVENAMDAYTKMIYPFWVVDFPLEIALDTVLLPIDGAIYLCQDKPKTK